MSDLVFPPISQPGQNGPLEYVVYDLWTEIPEALDLVIYHDKIPNKVLPHDHGERRGSLIQIPLCQNMMGPQAPNGSAVTAWVQGVPLFPPLPGQSFVTNPKLIYVQPIMIPAGAQSLHVEMIFLMTGVPASRSVDLVAVLRPLSEHGMKPGFGAHYQVSLTHTDTSSPVSESRNEFQFPNLSNIGDIGLTKTDLLLEIWLVSNPTAGTTYKLLNVTPLWGAESTGNPTIEPVDWSGQKVTIEPASYRAGMIVDSSIAVAAHKRWNQITAGALGRAPGLAQDVENVDEKDVYLHYVRRRHRHYGRAFKDPYYNNERVNDGSVIRTTLWSQNFFSDYGDNASDMSTNPPSGVPIHPNGTLNTAQGWLNIEGRLEMAIGQRSVVLRVGIAPRTTLQLSRLWLYADFRDGITGGSLPFYFGLGTATADTSKSGTFTKALITPIDGRLWQRNQERLAAGLGLWTEQATAIPAPANALGVSRVSRISKDVRLVLTNPLTRTGGVILRLAFELETGQLGSGVRDNNAALQFIDVFTPSGF